MKIALAQMRMTEKISENLTRSLRFCDEAADSDLLFFPEIQLTPFFPQYEKRSAAAYCLHENAEEIRCFAEKAAQHGFYLSPNVYLRQNGHCYDASLWITPDGTVQDIAKMVHIA